MGFSREEYWSGLSCPPLGHLPNPATEAWSPALQVDSLPSEPPILLYDDVVNGWRYFFSWRNLYYENILFFYLLVSVCVSVLGWNPLLTWDLYFSYLQIQQFGKFLYLEDGLAAGNKQATLRRKIDVTKSMSPILTLYLQNCLSDLYSKFICPYFNI